MMQLDALKAKHAQELAEVVREHNKRYSDMLAQRLNDEDELRDKLLAEHKVYRIVTLTRLWLTCALCRLWTPCHVSIRYPMLSQAALEELKHDHRIALHRLNGDIDAERAARMEISKDAEAARCTIADLEKVCTALGADRRVLDRRCAGSWRCAYESTVVTILAPVVCRRWK